MRKPPDPTSSQPPRTIKPLYLDFSAPALAELSGAVEFARALRGENEDAEHFAARVAEVFRDAATRLAEEVAENETGKPFDPVDEAASVHFSRPTYRLRIETAKRRAKRSTAGFWYAYYTLKDVAETGKPDTLYVYAIRHSGALPIGQGDN